MTDGACSSHRGPMSDALQSAAKMLGARILAELERQREVGTVRRIDDAQDVGTYLDDVAVA